MGNQDGVQHPSLAAVLASHGDRLDTVERLQADQKVPAFLDLSDVGGKTTPTNGAVPIYDSAHARWVPGAAGGIQGDRLGAENTSGTTVAGSVSTTIPLGDFLDDPNGTSITQDASFNFMTIVTAGFYSIDACVQFDELGAVPVGNTRIGFLVLSASAVSPPRVAVPPCTDSIEHFTRVPLHMTWHFAASTTVTLKALHDGASLSVFGFMNILRLS